MKLLTGDVGNEDFLFSKRNGSATGDALPRQHRLCLFAVVIATRPRYMVASQHIAIVFYMIIASLVGMILNWIYLHRPKSTLPIAFGLRTIRYKMLCAGSMPPTLEEKAGYENCVKLCNKLLGGIKWLPGILALVPIIWAAPRWPSEPKNTHMIRDDPHFLDWNHIEPRTSQHRSYTDMPSQEELSAGNTADSTSNGNDSSVLGAQEEHVRLHRFTPTSSKSRDMGSSDSHHHTQIRLLGPRFLCVLDESESRGYKTICVDNLRDTDSGKGILDYVFMSYTRRQFYTQITGDPTLPSETNLMTKAAAERDRATLVACAVAAAKSAQVEAFWIDFECVQPEGEERNEDSVEDVYRICDIARAAYSLVIVTGPPLSGPHYGHDSSTARMEWLKEWGSRLWTVPEALLAPTEHRITIYIVGTDKPEVVAKRNLASRVWDDADLMRQLIDHYESSIHLTPLEHISIALECLQRRQTEQRMSGDVAYALMGLLRQRPKVNKHDSAFEAFARLSFANDIDNVLERLICLRPTRQDAPWYDMHDQWNAALRDIQPLCEVTDLAGNDAVVLGDVRGAVINWFFLEPVDYEATSTRPYAWFFARTYPAVVMWGILLLIGLDILSFFVWPLIANPRVRVTLLSYYSFAFMFVVLVGLLISLISPLLLLRLFRGKIHQTQARFFGVEGVPRLDKVEEIILGSNRQRFSWERDIDCEEPSGDSSEDPERLRQFTLIDTLTLSAINFVAKRPSNAIFACGREPGYVRSALCSYDVDSSIFHRETIIRMNPTILHRIPEVDRVRFSTCSRA